MKELIISKNFNRINVLEYFNVKKPQNNLNNPANMTKIFSSRKIAK
jgi:hypothetical protein